MLAAISASHRSPLLSSFSLLYSSSSWVSVAYSKFGPWVKNQMRKVTLRVICRLSQKDIPFFFSGVCLRQNRNTKIHFSHLNNGVNRTGFLTETTIDALRHIDIVTRSSPAAIGSSLSFNGNGLRRKTKWPIVEWAGLNLGGHLFLLIINGIASAIKRSLIDLWSIHFWNLPEQGRWLHTAYKQCSAPLHWGTGGGRARHETVVTADLSQTGSWWWQAHGTGSSWSLPNLQWIITREWIKDWWWL